MRARHTQARRQFRTITSKALVNRARMKVVNIALTKILTVMAGLDPAIHVFFLRGSPKTWMPGTSPGMTASLLRTDEKR